MTSESLDIDRLVREVVRRLTETREGEAARVALPALAPSRQHSAVASPPSTVGKMAVPASDTHDEWRLATRLVTLESLAARPAAARVLWVARGTVVTPAARDQLRLWRMELKFVAPSNSEAAKRSAAPVGKLYLHASTGVKSPPSLVRSLASLSWTVEPLVAAPLPQAIAELAAVLGESGRIGVLLSADRDLALCLANRWSTVRAMAVDDKAVGAKALIETAVREWGANLLVVDPRRVSEPTLRGWIEAFARLGPRGCPAAWKKHLERT